MGGLSSRRGLLLSGLMILGGVTPAVAQDGHQAHAAASNGAGQGDNGELPEILITAQRREQTLQDVPISVSVVSGAAVDEGSFDDLAELSRTVPNLSVSNAALNNLVFVRGIGSGSNVGFEQAVGLFVDEVYLSRVRYMRQPFLDIARVEVLKGPQGTLFGRNTIAGAISVTSAAPTRNFFAESLLDYDATLDAFSATGVISGPLWGETRGRIAARYSTGGGYVENSSNGADGPGRDELAFRASLLVPVSDALRLTLKAEHSDFEVTGSTIQITTAGGALPRFLAADPQFETKLNGKRSVGGLTTDRDHTRTTLLSGRADWDGQAFRVTSLTGYAAYDMERDLDSDFSPLPFLATIVPDESYEQFSQDVRISSLGGGMIDWIVGGYYEGNEFDTLDRTDFNGPGSGSPTLAPVVASSVTRFSQDASILSFFGQATWNITEELSATGGLRWNREEKDGAFVHQLTQFGTLDQPLTSAAARNILRVGLGRQDASASSQRVEKELTPSFGLQWDRDDLLIYARYAEGFKAGGFNGAQTAPATAANPFEFEPESARSYEAGAKYKSGQFELTAAAFRTDYKDLQVSVFNGTTFTVGNAAEARSQGIELDGRWRAARWLTLSGSVAYLDAEYTNYRNAPCPVRSAAMPFPGCTLAGTSLVQDLTGKPLIYAPDWKGSVAADVEHSLTSDLEFRARGLLTFTSSYFMTADNDPIDSQEGYAKLDLRLAVGSSDGHWELALLGRNLTDQATSNVANDVPAITGAHYRAYDQPRSVAVQFRITY